MRLKEAAGWNQTRADWETVLRLSPDGCWVFEADGQAVGATTAITYGTGPAWIGMVLVLPEYRRRGIARRLMEHALGWCGEKGVKTVKLDATDMGRPLYASLGFEDEEPIERWGRDPIEAEIPTAPEQTTAGWDLDPAAFGVERSAVLEALAAAPDATSAGGPDGYAMARPGSQTRFLGPLVARTSEAAEHLARQVLAQRPGASWCWDLLPSHWEAAELAARLGFRPLRRLSRMARPRKALGQPSNVWATAGFEYG